MERGMMLFTPGRCSLRDFYMAPSTTTCLLSGRPEGPRFSTSKTRPFRPAAKIERRGFTLIEVLVTVGIIVVLTSLAIPAILRSRQKAIVIRIRSDLSLISNALEAYKSDFGDYPRFDDDATFDSLNVQHDRGARLLCRALLGPAPLPLPVAGLSMDMARMSKRLTARMVLASEFVPASAAKYGGHILTRANSNLGTPAIQ